MAGAQKMGRLFGCGGICRVTPPHSLNKGFPGSSEAFSFNPERNERPDGKRAAARCPAIPFLSNLSYAPSIFVLYSKFDDVFTISSNHFIVYHKRWLL